VPFGEEAEYSRKMLVARGILCFGREARSPVGEGHLSIAWTVPAYWKLGLYLQVTERVGAEQIELSPAGTEKSRTGRREGLALKQYRECYWEETELIPEQETATESVPRNWESRNANETNENRSVRTGQGELANRLRIFNGRQPHQSCCAISKNP